MNKPKSNEPASWFWQNYAEVMKWQNQHLVAYWQARCKALEEENKYLHKCLEPRFSQQHSTNMRSHSEVAVEQHPQLSKNNPTTSSEQEQQYDCAEEYIEEDEEEFVFEVNEEMLAFLETSAKHKLELKRQRETEEKEREDRMEAEGKKLRFPQQSIQERRDEMEKIYGSAGSMILSMETAMQLSFDRFNDKYQPKCWPNIPLNL